MIDASKAAQEVGLRGRTNTILQTCFFALSGVLPRDEAITRIKDSIRKTYAEKGEEVVQRNFRAVDGTLDRLHEVKVPAAATSRWDRAPVVPAEAPEFVRRVTAKMFEARGDEIPVSLMPVDGTFPSGTAAFEKRNLADIRARMGAGHLHPVRAMQLRLPARRHPREILSCGQARRRPGHLQIGADQCARLPGCALLAAVLRRGLHGLRVVRRDLSCPQRDRA